MLFLFITLVLGDYVSHPNWYVFQTMDDASNACVDLGLTLCSTNQLYTIAYVSSRPDYNPNICYSGWTTTTTGDYQRGWWNNNQDECGLATWHSWAPDAGWGAHCCSSDVPETTPAKCSSFTCGVGFQTVENYDTLFCADGECNSDKCCMAWTKAVDYTALPGQQAYVYTSGDQAKDACEAEHPDYTLCTKDQVHGLAEAGLELCSSGWWVDSFEGATDASRWYDNPGQYTYGTGWYVGTQYAADGQCGGIAEEKTWTHSETDSETGDVTYYATAHCCVKDSFSNSGYHTLANDGYNFDLDGAAAWCTANEIYNTEVCTKAQLYTIANIENPNICTSGIYRAETGSSEWDVGFYQGVTQVDGTDVCGGPNGWPADLPAFGDYDPGVAAAFCCSPYVLNWDLFAVLPDYDISPDYYSISTFATGEQAETYCLESGYDQLCTQNQVIYIGTNLDPELCLVGWAFDGTDFVTGFYATQGGCASGSWNTYGLGGDNPLAFCCMNTDVVPELSLVQDAYYNGGWAHFDTQNDAEAFCTGDYSLCTVNQLYTIAEIGVELSDGSNQVEPEICQNGWTSGGEVGWWQGTDGCYGGTWPSSGWVGGSTRGTYHCCLPFIEQTPGSDEPTNSPTDAALPAFNQIFQTYTFPFTTESQASDACKNVHPDYKLCSAAQIVQAAVVDTPGDDTFEPVEAQTSLCAPAFVDRSENVCDPAIEVGWFSVYGDQGCGEWNSWNFWAPTNDQEEYTAGAYCCGPSLVADEGRAFDLGCAETTIPPTVSPTFLIYFPLETDVASQLGLASDVTSQLYTKDGQYYYRQGDTETYDSLCVGYGAENDVCDYTAAVCAGYLRLTYGTYAAQGVLVQQALAESDNLHVNCPAFAGSPSDCVEYTGYSPEDFESMVSYCVYDGCYYMNGMETCVCDATTSDVGASLQNVWENIFDLTECPDQRTFNENMDDQLTITGTMVDTLENDIDSIPDVNSQLAQAQSDLTQIWNDWSVEITTSINSAIDDANSAGDAALVTSLENILEDLEALTTTTESPSD